ncbi:unnamed protein product [Nesidiocoris tenuis]|uniref:SCY1-like protein 2 n=1 Tax=Nesidiocoris tenuis TaxID=355587 RepID=A0A6H5GMK2_9HEMI|nr:unnamed protein product [Nesidiocoris tenuis]
MPTSNTSVNNYKLYDVEIKYGLLQLKTVQASQFSQVADGLRILVKMMLNATPELRPDEHDFIKVRVNCLVCIGKLIDHLDKWLVLDEVLPFLPQIPSKEPAVLMGILGIYKLVLSSKKMTISKEMMAQKIIPFLMPLAVENFLTLNQFNTIISVIHDMVSRVEAEHRVKLEQLQEQQK